MSLYTRVLGFLRPHAGVLALATVATVGFAVLDTFVYVLLIPFAETLFVGEGAAPTGDGPMARLLDLTLYRFVDLGGDPLDAVRAMVVAILIVFALKNVFDFGRGYLSAKVEQSVTRDVRNAVYEHLLELDLLFFSRTRVGQVVSRLTGDVDRLRSLVTHELLRVFSSLLEFAAALAAMLLISWKLTVAAFVVVPTAMAMWGPMVGRLRRDNRRVLDLGGDVAAHVQETLSGIRLVKTSSAEATERTRFRRLTAAYYEMFMRTERLRALAAPATEMLAAAGTVVLLWYGARLVVLEGDLTGAEFVGFLALSMKLYSPVKVIAKFPAIVQPGLVAAERVFEFLDAPPEHRERAGTLPFPGLAREVAFESVGFAYRPGEPVLRDVSFTVPAGTVVALVGPSGAGKSTLVDLLGRFLDPDEGRITIDGDDLREVRTDELRRNLGVVSQETVLFHETVRANIAYGRPDASHEEVVQAARAAHAWEFVSRLPQGLDTVVGERGTVLSGGERQRLAIARAILRDPPILIFDEATSSLDSESERLVREAVEELLEGRTVFLIAHRLSTVQRADQILVLDRGRVVERGDHDALMARSGLYRRLWELQFRDGADSGAGAGGSHTLRALGT